ncbi:MAG: arsR-type protein [Thermoproteota archaeon]|nr:arsR-type protein [Thermoproteota archaeon]
MEKLSSISGEFSPETLLQTFEEIAKRIPKGVEYRILSPQLQVILANFENRTFSNCLVIFALTEKEAELFLRFLDGRIDYAGFIGSDPTFLNWVKDLFLYYLEIRKRF